MKSVEFGGCRSDLFVASWDSRLAREKQMIDVGLEQQAEDEDGPAPGAWLLALRGKFHGAPVAVKQPQADAQHDGPMHLLVAAPDAGEEVVEAGHIQHGQPDNHGQPGEQRLQGGLVVVGGTCAWLRSHGVFSTFQWLPTVTSLASRAC